MSKSPPDIERYSYFCVSKQELALTTLSDFQADQGRFEVY